MSQTGAILSRMKSIRQTVQISSAQKLIAASRIGKARRMLSDSDPYHMRIRQALARILVQHPHIDSRYLGTDEPSPGKRGMLIVSANAGLAGGYNSSVIRCAEEALRTQPVSQLIVLGQVGINHFLSRNIPLDTHLGITTVSPSLFGAREIAEYIVTGFESGAIDAFDVVYTHFYSTVRMTPMRVPLLPLCPEHFDPVPEGVQEFSFEPGLSDLMATLVPKYLKGFIYGCLVHAYASELASRIMAMDNAIRNGRDMLDRLSLQYNRMRQAAITQEITEIVAGAAAMEDE